MGNVNHWELRKKFKFDNTKKCYIHNPESVQENDTYKILWDFDIQTDHLISARWQDLIIVINKKRGTCRIVDFAVPADHKVKLKESEKKDKYLDLARELKKLHSKKIILHDCMLSTFKPYIYLCLGLIYLSLLLSKMTGFFSVFCSLSFCYWFCKVLIFFFFFYYSFYKVLNHKIVDLYIRHFIRSRIFLRLNVNRIRIMTKNTRKFSLNNFTLEYFCIICFFASFFFFFFFFFFLLYREILTVLKNSWNYLHICVGHVTLSLWEDR